MDAGIESHALLNALLPPTAEAVLKINQHFKQCDEVPGTVNGRTVAQWRKPPACFRDTDAFWRLDRMCVGLPKPRSNRYDGLAPLHWLAGRLGGRLVYKPDHRRVKLKAAASALDRTIAWLRLSAPIHLLATMLLDHLMNNDPSREEKGTTLISTEEGRQLTLQWAQTRCLLSAYLERLEVLSGRAGAAPAWQETRPACFSSVESWSLLDHHFREIDMSLSQLDSHLQEPFLRPGETTKSLSLSKWRTPRKCQLDDPRCTGHENAGAANPLDYALGLCQALGTVAPMQWLAGRAGSVFVMAEPPVKPATGGDFDNARQAVTALSRLDVSLAEALKDGSLDEDEKEDVAEAWHALVGVMDPLSARW
jgi:hypothetical protein